MKSLTITSSRTAAGKTTVGLGIALNSGMKCGYYKPYGDHLVYSKKSLHDLDAMVYQNWMGMGNEVLESTLGFDADKIISHWNSNELKSVLKRNYDTVAKGKDLMIVETARNYSFGGHMDMDSITLAQSFDSELLLVAEGDIPLILDKVLAIAKCAENIAKFKGIVINKVSEEDREKIEIEVPPILEKKGIKLLGIMPKHPELEWGHMRLVLEKLNAKLIAGGDGVGNIVKTVQVGALSAEQAMKMPNFFRENKVLITGGDRVDLIFACLGKETAGIVLTNNILPSSNIISKAAMAKVPLLLVHSDTFHVAKQVDDAVPLLTKDSAVKIQILEQSAKNLELAKFR